MAFSTQKEFFNVPFMNESFGLECKKACVKLKSYESTVDNRSWARDETKQSKFLSDLVTCQNLVGSGDGEEYFSSTDDELAKSESGAYTTGTTPRSLRNTIPYTKKTQAIKANAYDDSLGADKIKAQKSREYDDCIDGSKIKVEKQNEYDISSVSSRNKQKMQIQYNDTVADKSEARKQPVYASSSAAGNRDEELEIDLLLANMTDGDSLLECANIHLAEYQNLLNIKTTLEKKLEVSNERLQTAKEENKKIREILANKLDSNTTKGFYNKIQKFVAAGKLDKNEEAEMLQIYQKMENMYKAHETLEAANYYLKRLIEKITARVALDEIITEPEQSQDIDYLQKKINSLRKECILLRQMEDEFYILKQQQTNKINSISEKDAENIKSIIRERNGLREKCKSFKALEQQVHMLKQQTQEAKKETQYINEMEKNIQDMQKYYAHENQRARVREDCLRAQLEGLKDDLVRATCKAQKANALAAENSSLRNELLKRNMELNDFDCQYKQLIEVVNELHSVKLQNLNDNETQTCKDETEELAFYTQITLDEIVKELKKRGCFDDELLAAYGLEQESGANDKGHEKNCCREINRLQHQVDEMKTKMQEATNCEAICADALKRLKELENANDELVKKNQSLIEMLKDSEPKMENMLKKIEDLDSEINKNGQEANKIGVDLQGTIGLVKDISEMQLKNQQLANAVSAINSRDDQKIIDDLRLQLAVEQAKSKKCLQENAKLLEKSKVREIDLKELKKLNNKLLPDEKEHGLDDNDNRRAEKSKKPAGSPQDDAEMENIEKLAKRKSNDEVSTKQPVRGQRKHLEADKQHKPKTLASYKEKDVALDDFVSKKSNILKYNLQQGRSFEKEFRNILDDFILECSYCFCRLFNNKSKLYAIGHKLCHSGIESLTFQELAYLHKNIYAQADQILPGCLLDMLLSDHKEQAERMLTSGVMQQLIEDKHFNLDKRSDTNIHTSGDIDKKCCCCKNELCCNNSEEMLKEKVNKLEKDIEIAREYLETLKHISLDANDATANEDSTDTNNSTYRASSQVTIPHKIRCSKHLKKQKYRTVKHPDLLL